MYSCKVCGQVMSGAERHSCASDSGYSSSSITPPPVASPSKMQVANTEILRVLSLLGREHVNQYIIYWDKRNGSVCYESDKIKHSLQMLDAAKKEARITTLNLDGLLQLSGCFQAKLGEENNYSLVQNFGDSKASWQDCMDMALSKIDMSREPIRFLVPGNNDQANPMFLAQQIKYILDSVDDARIAPNIQVLVMGKGGHATTATFPQFAKLEGKDFYGITEAESLSMTLEKALFQLGIGVVFVDNFRGGHCGRVRIKLAKESTNTGENVKEALSIDDINTPKPAHIFVSAAITASTRQALTFACQYSKDPKDFLAAKEYQTITAIPLPRSKKFVIRAFSDHQAVTEMYAGLAERCRFYAYSYGASTYIPAQVIDVQDLFGLYNAYSILSGTSFGMSKTKTIQELMKFFGDNFSIMENSIAWNMERENQETGTLAAMQAMAKSYKR